MSTLIEKITDGKDVLAIIVRSNYKDDSAGFITDNDNELQLRVHEYKKDHLINPHVHKKLKRTINSSQEFIYIDNGVVEVTFFNKNRELEKKILRSGDMLLHIDGGHSFKMIEESKLVVIKQGPYIGSGEKILIDSRERI